MGIVSQRLRDSARGQPCTLQIAGICNHDPATTVLAHLPSEVKGTGNKSDDFHAAFACSACHEHLDQNRLSLELKWYYCLRGLQRTLRWWIENGYIVIDGKQPKARTESKKILPRKLSWQT